MDEKYNTSNRSWIVRIGNLGVFLAYGWQRRCLLRHDLIVKRSLALVRAVVVQRRFYTTWSIECQIRINANGKGLRSAAPALLLTPYFSTVGSGGSKRVVTRPYRLAFRANSGGSRADGRGVRQPGKIPALNLDIPETQAWVLVIAKQIDRTQVQRLQPDICPLHLHESISTKRAEDQVPPLGIISWKADPQHISW